MAQNRKKAQDFILKTVEAILPGGGNKALYEKLFESLSDAEFAKLMGDLRQRKRYLCLVVPNFAQARLSVERNLEIAEELGFDFFEQLQYAKREEIPAHTTPIEYLVVDLPLKRAAQFLVEKTSIPKDMRSIDVMSGQPTGDSKGAKITFPELQVCAAMGLNDSMVELMKYRGGDTGGRAAMNQSISVSGTASQAALSRLASGVQSTKTLKTFFLAAHLKSTL